MIFARLITLTFLAGAVSAISIPKQQRNVIAFKPEVLPLVKARSSVEHDRVRRNQYKRSASSSKTQRAKRATGSLQPCTDSQVRIDSGACYQCNTAGGLKPGVDGKGDTTCVCTKGNKYSAGGVDRCSCENGSMPNETQVCVNGGIYQCAPGLTAGPNAAGDGLTCVCPAGMDKYSAGGMDRCSCANGSRPDASQVCVNGGIYQCATGLKAGSENGNLTCVCPEGQTKSSSGGHDICLTPGTSASPMCDAETQVIDDAGHCYTCNAAGGLKPGVDANGDTTCVCPSGFEKSSEGGMDVCLGGYSIL